jgi:hypothetical protein
MAKKRGKYVGFGALKGKLKKKGVRNPGAVAAKIGRKKYGKKGMAKLSSQGRRKGASHSTAARKSRAARVKRR